MTSPTSKPGLPPAAPASCLDPLEFTLPHSPSCNTLSWPRPARLVQRVKRVSRSSACPCLVLEMPYLRTDGDGAQRMASRIEENDRGGTRSTSATEAMEAIEAVARFGWGNQSKKNKHDLFLDSREIWCGSSTTAMGKCSGTCTVYEASGFLSMAPSEWRRK